MKTLLHSFPALAVAPLALALALPLSATAQIALDDVFADRPEGSTITLSELRENPGLATALLERLAQDTDEGRHEAVLLETEVLSAWFARDSAEYGEVMWLRARAMLGKEDERAFRSLAAEFIGRTAYATHPRRAWFLTTFAARYAAVDEIGVAADAWEVLLREKHEIATYELLAGVGIALRAGRAESARALLATLGEDIDEVTRQRAEFLRLESLLILDDRLVALPDAREGTTREALAFNLRRALLMDWRGRTAEADGAYRALEPHRAILGAAERSVLNQRLVARTTGPI